jgi:hypothetical protein
MISTQILQDLKVLVLPIYTTAQRDALVADVGTIIYNSSTNKINFCKTKAAGSGNWEAVTSA